MTEKELLSAVSKAEKLLGIELKYEFSLVPASGVYAAFDGKTAKIGGNEKADIYRAIMLLATEIKKGNNEFEINQKRNFETLGMSLDLSRNGVMTVERVREVIDILAFLGFNLVMLYMEDVFELPGYPHFGYRRGRYTREELKEIDDYAYSMGVEAVPSIETLGHLEQYLRYGEASGFAETPFVLECENEKAIQFVEAMIKTMRECFRSKRININCDEAAGVGIKKILREKKYTAPWVTVTGHLETCVEICRKYDFEPIADGDFFYGHIGKGYYDFEFEATEEDIKNIPDQSILYWDYYHTAYEDYETLLKGHLSLGRKVIFLGGMWIWSGQLPNVDFTFDTMIPAMECCLDYGVKDVWAATFGDDGFETNMAFSYPTLLIFSEYCFRGRECKKEDIYSLAKSFFQIDMEEFRALSSFHYPWVQGLTRAQYIHPLYMGKIIFWSDVLLNMTGSYNNGDVLEKHTEALEKIKDAGKGTPWEGLYDYARLIFEITTEKIPVIDGMRKAYEDKDAEWLKAVCDEKIPSLINKYSELQLLHEKQWMNIFKPFGWEELDGRYGWVIARLKGAKRRIEAYLSGEISSVPELEYEYIEERYGMFAHGSYFKFSQMKSTCV